MNAVDTNVLIYALDVDDQVKHTKAIGLLQKLVLAPGSTIMPWQVAGELLANLRKRESAGRVTADEVHTYFRNFLAMFPLVIPGAGAFQVYFDLRSRFSLSHWDTMLLASCKLAGVTTLFSEDMDPGTDFDGLRIVNPFG
jgi:predicted nucleic acid-binding protein